MLTAEKLTKRYPGKHPVDAVDGIDLLVNDGEFLAIVGRSGSGKSTLLAMLGGLCRPTNGNVLIGEANQWKLRLNEQSDFRNRKIGFVFQFASLLPSLRALDNVALPAMISGLLTEKQAYSRARALLEQVGLGTRYDFYPSEMSGGEQRRVAIARALINSPDVLLADEPTADLDEQTEAEILDILIEIKRRCNLTLIVVTHNTEVASRADRIIQMRSGKVVSETNRNVGELGSPSADGSNSVFADRLASQSAVDGVKRIFDLTAAGSDEQSVTLGEGFATFVGRLVLFLIPLIAVLWCVNFGVSAFEQRLIEAQTSTRRALEELAMTGLRAEVKEIKLDSDNSYDVSVYLRNTLGAQQPIYVLMPTVRGFVQVGSNWQEAPLTPITITPQKVLKITGEQIYHYRFTPNIPNFSQLLPYYMHVRFTNEMIVSDTSQPKSDLIERSDSYYVYLKPHNVSDADIAKKMNFQGPAPVWIPMPPH